MKSIALLILNSSLLSCSQKLIYLDNETMKTTNDVRIGKKYKLNRVKYLIVDENMLRSMVENREDVTKGITTNVTDMSDMFD